MRSTQFLTLYTFLAMLSSATLFGGDTNHTQIAASPSPIRSTSTVVVATSGLGGGCLSFTPNQAQSTHSSSTSTQAVSQVSRLFYNDIPGAGYIPR